MVEYINSNDDAGNMALYAGIGVATFAAGAALAYRATSPIYKDGDKSKGKADGRLVMKYDDQGGKKPASFLKGALKGSTLGLINKKARDSALSQMSQSVMDDSADRIAGELLSGEGLYAKKFGVVSDSYNKGLANLGDDVAKAQDIIENASGKKPMTAQGAVDQILKSNPSSLVQADDVQRRMDRSANPQMSRADLEVAGTNRYAELQAEAQAYRDRGEMTPQGKKNLEKARKVEAEQAAEKASRKNEKAAARQQRADAWEKDMLSKHAPYQDTKELLGINPNMSNEAILAQVPNAEKIQDVVDTQRLRAQQKAMPEQLSLQERLAQKKRYQQQVIGAMRDRAKKDPKAVLDSIKSSIVYPENLTTPEQKKEYMGQWLKENIGRTSAELTVDANRASGATPTTKMGGTVIRGDGKFQSGTRTTKAGRKAAILKRMLGH